MGEYLMELIVRNVKATDGKIIKALFVKDTDGVETNIAYSREHGFSTVYPLDRESEDNARAILEKALTENYEGKATELMKCQPERPVE